MKTFRCHDGPFSERPYYEDAEIEGIASDELRAKDLLPTSPGPIRIDRFIEKRFGISPQFDDLPEGVLGFTRFGARGPEEVVLSRQLAEEGTAASDRRLTSTLAHEGGHMLLHGHLFSLERPGGTRALIDDVDGRSQRILCRADVVGVTPGSRGRTPYDGRWWEYQANQMIGPLLMPRALATTALAPMLTSGGTLAAPTLRPDRREEAARLLVEVFDINPAAARVRLDNLFPASATAQLPL